MDLASFHCFVGLAAVPPGVHPDPGGQLGGNVQHQLPSSASRWARDGPAPWHPSTADRRVPRPGPSATVRDASRGTAPGAGRGHHDKHGGDADLADTRHPSREGPAAPAPQPTGGARLTRAGARPLPWPHELPDPGISHQFSSSSPYSGKSHRFPGSSLGHSNSPYSPVSGHAGLSPGRGLPPAPGDRRLLLAPPSGISGRLGPQSACFQGDGLGGVAGACAQGSGGRVIGEGELLLA